MLLPKETIPGKNPFVSNSDVYLESGHLCIKKGISDRIFGDGTVVLTVYYPQDHRLLIAPTGEEYFKKIHKARQQMLKSKNLFGDKSISLQELLLDEGLEETNRDLDFVWEEKLKILNVKL